MVNFEDNAEIKKEIADFTQKLIFNVYTGEVWDPEVINEYKRMDLAREFIGEYFSDYRLKFNGYDDIGGKNNLKDFQVYVAYKIDRLIPRLYFLEVNKGLTEEYTLLLTNRIFMTHGKDGYMITSDLVYEFKHDFSEEEQYIKESSASEKQTDYLNTLAKQQGFQLINKEYLSKMNANHLIEYLKGDSEIQPIVFSFFITVA